MFTVPLQHVRFPNGGGSSFFVCCLRSPVPDAAAVRRRARLQGLSGGEGFALWD